MVDYIVLGIISLGMIGVIYYNFRQLKKGNHGGCSSGCGHCNISDCSSRVNEKK